MIGMWMMNMKKLKPCKSCVFNVWTNDRLFWKLSVYEKSEHINMFCNGRTIDEVYCGEGKCENFLPKRKYRNFTFETKSGEDIEKTEA